MRGGAIGLHSEKMDQPWAEELPGRQEGADREAGRGAGGGLLTVLPLKKNRKWRANQRKKGSEQQGKNKSESYFTRHLT